jgi:hypothetical protein
MGAVELPAVLLPRQLVDVRTGEVVDATPEKAAELIVAARDMRQRLLDLVKDCEAVILEESRVQGTKTLHFPEGTATITGGSEVEWDIETLAELRQVGLPEERWNELVKTTVSEKVDAAVAKQLAAANPAYAALISAARREVPKAWRVSLR